MTTGALVRQLGRNYLAHPWRSLLLFLLPALLIGAQSAWWIFYGEEVSPYFLKLEDPVILGYMCIVFFQIYYAFSFWNVGGETKPGPLLGNRELQATNPAVTPRQLFMARSLFAAGALALALAIAAGIALRRPAISVSYSTSFSAHHSAWFPHPFMETFSNSIDYNNPKYHSLNERILLILDGNCYRTACNLAYAWAYSMLTLAIALSARRRFGKYATWAGYLLPIPAFFLISIFVDRDGFLMYWMVRHAALTLAALGVSGVLVIGWFRRVFERELKLA